MDLFNHFVKPSLKSIRTDWSNLSDDIVYTPPPDNDKDKLYNGRKWSEYTDVERASPESPENCQKACEAGDACLQWQHHGNECNLHMSIRLGSSKQEGGTKWVSGWQMDRIEKFQVVMKECKGSIEWKVSGP